MRRKTTVWRWANVPLPEAHLLGIGAGVLLHVVMSWRLFGSAWIGNGAGWPLLLAGLWLAGWAVRAAAWNMPGWRAVFEWTLGGQF